MPKKHYLLAEFVSTLWACIEDSRPFVRASHLQRTEPHLFITALGALFLDCRFVCSSSILPISRSGHGRDELPFKAKSGGEGGRIGAGCESEVVVD